MERGNIESLKEFVGLPHTALVLKLFFIKQMPVRIKSTVPRLPFFPSSLIPLCRPSCRVNSCPVKRGRADKNQQREVFLVVWFELYLFWWQIPWLAFHECCLNLSSNQSQEMRSVISSFSDMRKLNPWDVMKGHRNFNWETLASLIIGNVFRTRICTFLYLIYLQLTIF